MNNTIRCFIALELTPGIHEKLARVIKTLKENIPDGVKWVPVENIHLTIKFLGDVAQEDIGKIKRVLEESIKGIPPVEVNLKGLGAFPGLAKPRVIWIGLNAQPVFYKLVANINQQTDKIGYPGDNRPFTPHLTLGRTSKWINPSQLKQLSIILSQNPYETSHQDTLNDITLFRSTLTPSGALYNKLYTIELK